MAQRFPASHVTAVSNSDSQRDYIERQARERGLANLRVITCDMNRFEIDEQFDRVVSVEMFEHMRNYQVLFGKVAGWLAPGGRFFMHIFVHRSVPYLFDDRGADDWMSRHFFSGGMMPSVSLPLHFQDHLRLRQQWHWSGEHYEKTANAWLDNVDRNRAEVWQIMEETYGPGTGKLWMQRWRVFFMACAELWGSRAGQEWFVSHYLFERRE
jgi:cyclopropane-fatty-acyl-phospholipid synthase